MKYRGFFTTMEEKHIEFNRPLKVLVIEDNPVDQRMLRVLLAESAEYTSFVEVAESLTTALKILKNDEFDVVVVDLDLPDSKGEDTLNRLTNEYPNLPIVVNTGAYEEGLGIKTLSMGAQDFLVKGKYTGYTINKVLHYAFERKRLELELKAAYKKLKETQNILIQTEKMKVVGSLASGVAHEVKNPLATILYGTTYLSEQKREDDENYESVVKNIKEAAQRANDIITDLLDFSSLSKLHRQKENLNKILDKALALVKHEVDKNEIKVVQELDKGLPEINIDRNRIEQVLINMILNAISSMADGGEIKITTYSLSLSKALSEIPKAGRDGFKAGDQVVILNVDDSGEGIGDEQLDKIFDPFFTTKRAGGGIGLGLAVCRNIMDNHQGTIFVENRKEGGARATLVFKA